MHSQRCPTCSPCGRLGKPVLIEVKPSSDYKAGLAQLTDQLKGRGPAIDVAPALLSWLKGRELSTPALVFDLDTITARMQALAQTAANQNIACLLAVKSCPREPLLKTAQQHLAGFDVSNLAEYRALPADLSGKTVSLTSPQLTKDYYLFAARGNRLVVTVDSIAQCVNYLQQGAPFPYVLRIQGGQLLPTSDAAYTNCSRFGFTAPMLEQLLQRPDVQAQPPCGWHVHHGSEINSAATYQFLMAGLAKLGAQLPEPPAIINLGGGWHSVEKQQLNDLFALARKVFPEPCSVFIEPGQWFGKGAGLAVGEVVNKSGDDDNLGCVLNLSMDCHLRWSSPRLLVPVQLPALKFAKVYLGGASCYEADSLGCFMLPYRQDLAHDTSLGLGCRVLLSNISLYSLAWNQGFNGIAPATEYWLRNGLALEPTA